MNMLSNSMERLGMSQPTESPSTITEKKDLQLKKKQDEANTSQRNTTTLLSRSGKSTGKYSKAWNDLLLDGSVKSVDFERDITMLEEISGPIAIERDREDTPLEIKYSYIYLSEIEQN